MAEADGSARLNVGEPFDLRTIGQMEGTSEVTLYDESGVLAEGLADVDADLHTGDVHLVLELTGQAVTRKLEQQLRLEDGVLSSWGSLTIVDGVSTTTLHGGWGYDAVGGPVIDQDSDPGFEDELAAMLNVGDAPTRAFSLGSIASFIGNIVGMVVHYTIDILVPYEPPASCSGPRIYNANGQSCDGVDVACETDLDEACEMLDGIPGVSIAFKQCMKGRCGCGGSSFNRLRISCDLVGDCGSCSGSNVVGCSLAGSHAFYCAEPDNACECIGFILHEMSHGCGALDSNGESYRIGEWFEMEFDRRFPNRCAPAGLGD